MKIGSGLVLKLLLSVGVGWAIFLETEPVIWTPPEHTSWDLVWPMLGRPPSLTMTAPPRLDLSICPIGLGKMSYTFACPVNAFDQPLNSALSCPNETRVDLRHAHGHCGSRRETPCNVRANVEMDPDSETCGNCFHLHRTYPNETRDLYIKVVDVGFLTHWGKFGLPRKTMEHICPVMCAATRRCVMTPQNCDAEEEAGEVIDPFDSYELSKGRNLFFYKPYMCPL